MKRLFLICMAFILLLCGCAEVPANVRNNEEILNSKNHANTESEQKVNYDIKERGTLDEIRAQLEYDLENNHTRISIDKARVSKATEMPTTNIKIYSKDLKNEGGKVYRAMIDILFKGMYDTKDENNYIFYVRMSLGYQTFHIQKSFSMMMKVILLVLMQILWIC